MKHKTHKIITKQIMQQKLHKKQTIGNEYFEGNK